MRVAYLKVLLLIAVCLFATGCSIMTSRPSAPLRIEEQGSFAVGGTVVTNPGSFDPVKMSPAGQTLHGDHLCTFCQVPTHARQFPLVMWHGYGQSARTWETTPDGREGFQNIFLHRGFGVYLSDQPRRGRAGRSTQSVTLTPVPDEQKWFDIFRRGGDVSLVHLPEIGIRGNTHFPFSDLNNLDIADLLSAWLKQKGLD